MGDWATAIQGNHKGRPYRDLCVSAGCDIHPTPLILSLSKDEGSSGWGVGLRMGCRGDRPVAPTLCHNPITIPPKLPLLPLPQIPNPATIPLVKHTYELHNFTGGSTKSPTPRQSESGIRFLIFSKRLSPNFAPLRHKITPKSQYSFSKASPQSLLLNTPLIGLSPTL